MGQDDLFDDLPSVDAGMAKVAFDRVCEEALDGVEAKVEAARADWLAAQEAHIQAVAAARQTLSDALEQAIKTTAARNKIEEALRIEIALQALDTGGEIPLGTTGRPARGNVKFGDSRFKLIREDLDWFAARARCEELGGRLATIATSEEQAFLAGLIDTVWAWVGAQDAGSEGQWQWLDGSEVTIWAEGQPDNVSRWEHATSLNRAGGLHDANATKRGPFLCEWGPPTAAPWNFGWRPALSALAQYSDRVRRADTARDESRARTERSLTRPRSLFLDKVSRAQRIFVDALEKAVRKEVQLGRTDTALRVREARSLAERGRFRPRFPVLDPALAPPEDALMVGAQRVKLVDEQVPWRVAEARCRQLGGRLLIVARPEILDWLKAQAEQRGGLWLGASRSAKEGNWSWLDGTPVDPAYFAGGQPDNTGGREDHLQAVHRGLNDRHSETRCRFVCEWPK